MLVNPYCTIEEVQVETVNANLDGDLDDLFASYINQASRMIDEICGTDFLYHDHLTTSFLVKPKNVFEKEIHLPFKILSLTELKIDGEVVDVDKYFFIDGEKMIRVVEANPATNYPFNKVECWGDNVFAYYPFKGRCEIKGTFGYTSPDSEEPPTDLPSEVRRACVLIAAAWSAERRVDRVGIAGEVSNILDTSIPEEARRLLRRYSLRRLTTF